MRVIGLGILSVVYILVSVFFVFFSKNRLRVLLLIPSVCQVISILFIQKVRMLIPPFSLFAMTYENTQTIVALLFLFLVNLLILAEVDSFVGRTMEVKNNPNEEMEKDVVSSFSPEKKEEFEVDTNLLFGDSASEDIDGSFKNTESALENSNQSDDFELHIPSMPEADDSEPVASAEGEPAHEEDLLGLSEEDLDSLIQKMLAEGDRESAKRYLRMLAFFAKDTKTRKTAENMLTEIVGAAQ